MNDKESLCYTSTIDLRDYFNTYQLSDGSLVNVRIMDTGGQERFKSINKKYYQKADCCLLVYDITDVNSFEEIKKYYIVEIKNRCPKDVKVILLGNKTDLEENRTINIENACSLAEENNFIFKETSCVKNENVADAFETLIEITYRDKREKVKINRDSIVLSKKNEKKKKNSCC